MNVLKVYLIFFKKKYINSNPVDHSSKSKEGSLIRKGTHEIAQKQSGE